MQVEVREESSRSIRGKRKNTERVKETGKRSKDKGRVKTVGVGGVDDADTGAPAPPLPTLIEIRGDPGMSYAGPSRKLRKIS